MTARFRKMIGGALLLAALPAGGSALAAPFCVQVTGVPDQCFYVDPAQCQREAERRGGRCGLNPGEAAMPVSAVPYCLVMAGNQASCLYPDRGHCDADAVRLGGACVAALPPANPPAPRPPSPVPGVDPFALSRP